MTYRIASYIESQNLDALSGIQCIWELDPRPGEDHTLGQVNKLLCRFLSEFLLLFSLFGFKNLFRSQIVCHGRSAERVQLSKRAKSEAGSERHG